MPRCWTLLACLALTLPACSKPADSTPPVAESSVAEKSDPAKQPQPEKQPEPEKKPAEKKPKPPAYLTAAEAGPDFATQGEYAGRNDEQGRDYGGQIIALGDGKFSAVFYGLGLPGAGWDGEHRIEVDATRNETGDLVIQVPAGAATLHGDTITIRKESADAPTMELKKVERQSPTLGAKPPEGAVVLFDGTSADAFEGGRMTDDGLLMEGVTSKQKFGDCTVHVEFMTPFMPTAEGQGRGNSGVYLQGRYEVQVLDSFGLEPADNLCGGIYEIAVPKLNMCFPPLSWQTYDIDYTTAKFDDTGQKTADARITVRHNGELIHDDVALTHATRSSPVAEGPDKGPLYLQDHHNPVRFRNVWVVEK